MLYNIRHPRQQVTFKEAVLRGIGLDNGLFFPASLPFFSDIAALLKQDFISRSALIIGQLVDGVLPTNRLYDIVESAFSFPLVVKQVRDHVFALELFHGPTLAFKDFGARFMAKLLGAITTEPVTIVTATSGDTGAAVAHAFHNVPNVRVVILYPHQRISDIQEKLFCTLGDNIETLAVKGDFDACQALVKRCFTDNTLKIHLNSANSINISRVFAQTCYYFEALAQVGHDKNTVVSVPSGNFGNLAAGLLARSMGLPVHRFVAATNSNDTVPRYLQTGLWQPHATKATLSNAMDVSQPNNWPRIEELAKKNHWQLKDILCGTAVDEQATRDAMLALQAAGYVADPHSAIAFHGLMSQRKPKENGIFLCTAHPAKFKESVEKIIREPLPLPDAIASVINKPLLSHVIPDDYSVLRDILKK